MSRAKKKSPLEKLVEIQQNQTLPVKVTPKNRLAEPSTRVVTPIIEDEDETTLPIPILSPDDILQGKNFMVSNSSLVVNLSLNVGAEAVDKAFEKSAEMAKKLAAGAAAMLGTALILGNGQSKEPKLSHPKVALSPKVKVPKFKKVKVPKFKKG